MQSYKSNKSTFYEVHEKNIFYKPDPKGGYSSKLKINNRKTNSK